MFTTAQGDSVNYASRMESHSVPLGIQMSPAAHAELMKELQGTGGPAEVGFSIQQRGEINIKGTSSARTYTFRKSEPSFYYA